MHQILSAESKCGGWPWTNMDVNMNDLIITIITIIILIIITIKIVILVIMIMIMNLWLCCLGEIFDMSKDDHVDKKQRWWSEQQSKAASLQ